MITVIGSLNMDLVTYTGRMPVPGETILGKSFKQVSGGKGANQADAIAKLGHKVMMIGCVGDDNMGNALTTSLESDGVDVSKVRRAENTSTGIASIIVDGNGNNCIIVVPGANNTLLPEHIEHSMDAIMAAEMVVAQLEVPIETVKQGMRAAKKQGKLTILNPAPAAPLDEDLLADIDILVPNDTELEHISGVEISGYKDMLKAADVLIGKGVKDVIVTLGEKGCLHVNREEVREYTAYKVKAVDTTAAGDSFIGGLAVALSEGHTLEYAIRFATAVGAITVTKEGAQSSLPSREEVDAFIKSAI